MSSLGGRLQSNQSSIGRQSTFGKGAGGSRIDSKLGGSRIDSKLQMIT